MNFEEAIQAHTAWKMKLASYLRTPDGSLNPSEVGVDNRCPLGQWIHGEAVRYADLPEYATLKSEHAKFHRAAAEVVARATSGQNVEEDIAVGSSSAFGKSSTAVVNAIMKMRRKVPA